jgi:proteasome lid subunit RPN8/RPN11
VKTPAPLILPSDLRSALEDEARREYPLESCGLLFGRAVGDRWRVERLQRARNVHPSPRAAFELDPGAILAALDSPGGQELLGFFHSHPDRPARPSAADQRGAWPESLALITAVDARGTCATRAFRLEPGRFFELETC